MVRHKPSFTDVSTMEMMNIHIHILYLYVNRARRWIEEKIRILDETLSEWEEENEGTILDDEKFILRAREHTNVLKRTIVASVALDSQAVFSTTENETCSNGKRGECKLEAHRKQVKSKAVAAMKEDGVDISSFKPKTIEEILPLIHSSEDQISARSDGEHPSDSTLNSFSDILIDGAGRLPSYHSHDDCDENGNDKPVDKLIVLCSCGDALKYKLARRSKSVEEWSIDAPTAAAKGGEGDKAYRRVSIQIRKEIKIMMESLLGDSCCY